MLASRKSYHSTLHFCFGKRERPCKPLSIFASLPNHSPIVFTCRIDMSKMEDGHKLTKESLENADIELVDTTAQQQEFTERKCQKPSENGKSTDQGNMDDMKVDLPDGKSTDQRNADDMKVDDAGPNEIPETKSTENDTLVNGAAKPLLFKPYSVAVQVDHVSNTKSSNGQNDVEMAGDDDAGTEEERAAFMLRLENFYKERFMEFKPPKFYGEPLNCLKLWRAVIRLGGYELVTASKLWRQVGESFHPPKTCTTVSWTFRIFYEKALLEYEKHKVQSGEIQVPISPFSQPTSVEKEANPCQTPVLGRARRDAAARAMQGWHAQRHVGYGEEKSYNSSIKHEKNLKSIGVNKQRTSSNLEHIEKATLPVAVNQLAITVADVGPPADWVKINVLENKDCFEIYALVPGLLREEVRIQSDPAGRVIITGLPEQLENPWGVTPFQKVVTLPGRIDPLGTSAVVSLHGRLFVSVPLEKV